MRIYIDIDNTICHTNGMEYDRAEPLIDNINKVNNLYNKGYNITMWTARGSLSNINFFEITYKQLIKWNVKFHELRMGKPAFDLLIDDKALNSLWNWNNNSIMNSLNYKIIQKFIIIIQARNNSTRCPNKVSKIFFENNTILDIIINRLKNNKFNIPVCIATTENEKDDEIYNKYNNKDNLLCFRGDENNVLDRFIKCAEYYKKEFVIRICSDNPFLSCKYLESLVETYINNQQYDYDYISYSLDGITPSIKTHIGIFSELVSLKALKRAFSETSESIYLEHVTNYIHSNINKFNILLLKKDFNTSFINNIRLTLDTKEDFDYLKNLYNELNIKNNDINFYKIIIFLYEHKDFLDLMIKSINKNIK